MAKNDVATRVSEMLKDFLDANDLCIYKIDYKKLGKGWNLDIYIDKNLLKYFDMDTLVLYGGTDKQPIRVYENETFVGIVCPTWIQKD